MILGYENTICAINTERYHHFRELTMNVIISGLLLVVSIIVQKDIIVGVGTACMFIGACVVAVYLYNVFMTIFIMLKIHYKNKKFS